MDTTKLVVGQDVYMFNDHYPHWFWSQTGKVVRVTPSGVEVEVVDLLQFETNDIPVFIVGQRPLVVGQDVDVVCERKDSSGKGVMVTPSGVERDRRGKVVKVMPEGVEVEVVDLLRFGNDGYELDVSRRDRFGFGPSPEDRFHTFLWESAPEFAPWHLDDMPFAERTVLLERRLAEVNNTLGITKLSLSETPLRPGEMTEIGNMPKTTIRLWRKRALYSTLALLLSCASVYPFLVGHSLHAHWNTLGKYVLLLSMGFLLVFVYTCGMWYGAWQALGDMEKEQG